MKALYIAGLLLSLCILPAQASSTYEAAVATEQAPERAQITSAADGRVMLVMEEPFDRAWRRVGLALDRIGFTVEDRDRAQGLYFVRYVDPDADNRSPDKGLLSRLAFWRSDDKPAQGGSEYRLRVEGQGDASRVSVLSREGGQDNSETARRMLGLLHEQLR